VLFTRAASVTLERRTAEWGDSTPPPPGGGDASSGVTISEGTALQLAAVYGSLDVIANAVATLRIQQFSSDLPTKRRLPDGPLLTRPYAEISRIDWLVQYVMSMGLRGNFFGHIIERDAQMYPTQIKPVHPDHANVRRIRSGPRKGQPEYRFHGRVIPTDDVFHIRNLSVPGALVGLNPIAALRNTFGLARAQDLHGSSVFGNSALPLGAIEVEDDLDPADAVALARAWTAAHGGVNRAGLPAVLTGGAKFNAISISLEDLQFLESRAFSQSEISGMIFHVPPHMLGLVSKSTSWGTGIAQQEQGFVTNTLLGYLAPLEEELTAVGPQDGRINRFDVNKRLRGDKLQRYQAYGLGIAGGWLCADNVLAEEDMPPLADGLGQTYLVPINSQTLEQAVKDTITPKNPPPAADQQDEGGADA
jgi:HK97 family phage portal protein